MFPELRQPVPLVLTAKLRFSTELRVHAPRHKAAQALNLDCTLPALRGL